MPVKKHPGGRPKIEIPLDQLTRLCQCQCSDDEIAAHFRCTTRTIEMRKRQPDFKEAMERGKANGRILLRSELFKQALGGKNPAALIFACKGILGISDRERVSVEHSGIAGKPIEVKQVADPTLLNDFLAAIETAKVNGQCEAPSGAEQPSDA